MKIIVNYDILINKKNGLKHDYIPSNLVDVASRYKDNIKLEEETCQQWKALKECVSGKCYVIEVESGYRSYEYQDKIWNEIIDEKGYEYAMKAVALPGYSEHQTGLALDYCVMRDNIFITENDIDQCEESIYTNSIAHKYGFIVRYPKGKENITGYKYEPWHLRYVGIDLATYLFVNNKTLDEYYEEAENEKS